MNITKQEYWNSRAALGIKAGTNDVIAKQLEIAEIQKYISDGMKVLEIGCGNGITAIEIAQKYDVRITAFDYAKEMISDAKSNFEVCRNELKGTIDFDVLDVKQLNRVTEKFDVVYCERVLINLDSWEEQEEVITVIGGLLNENGKFCMCENSADGLEMINSFRNKIGLETIQAPWHNRYFNEIELENFSKKGILKLAAVNSFTSTYAFLSRVINAWLAKQNGDEPRYDAPINNLAFDLPPIGNFGQTKLWLWEKM